MPKSCCNLTGSESRCLDPQVATFAILKTARHGNKLRIEMAGLAKSRRAVSAEPCGETRLSRMDPNRATSISID